MLAIDERDTAILAEKGVHVPHSPITYMKLAMPFPPLRDRLEAGVRVCLATDGPASNSDMDMFATVRQTALIHKYQSLDPEQIPGDLALRLATQASARALGFPEMGELRVGAPADLILVNLYAPHMRPVHSLVANLVHSAKGSDVTDVMVEGRWLMRRRELQTLDEARILSSDSEIATDSVNVVCPSGFSTAFLFSFVRVCVNPSCAAHAQMSTNDSAHRFMTHLLQPNVSSLGPFFVPTRPAVIRGHCKADARSRAAVVRRIQPELAESTTSLRLSPG